MKNTQLMHSAGCYALVLTGSALAPALKPGDVLAIDPTKPPKAGDAVLVSFHHRQRKPAQSGVMLLNADGDLIDYERGFVPAGSFTVLGVVIAARPLSETPFDPATGTVFLSVSE